MIPTISETEEYALLKPCEQSGWAEDLSKSSANIDSAHRERDAKWANIQAIQTFGRARIRANFPRPSLGFAKYAPMSTKEDVLAVGHKLKFSLFRKVDPHYGAPFTNIQKLGPKN